jgi:hypothetical protein
MTLSILVNKSVQGGLRQKDGHSCGPLVIRHARCRMLGQEVASRDVDRQEAKALRCETAGILQLAWENDRLIAAPEAPVQKRKGEAGKEGCQGDKSGN